MTKNYISAENAAFITKTRKPLESVKHGAKSAKVAI